jgi:endonuclease/exonuclease/phosphatase family metal-dependent hydrolase
VTRPRWLAVCLVAVLTACQGPVDETGTAAGASDSPGAAASAGARARSTAYSLLQMNLCLSGLAGCIDYPRVVDEAVSVIAERRPDAVTLSEVCRRDVARIAARTGYRWRFVAVPYAGRPLPCSSPGGRGMFGNAVLAGAAIGATSDHRFRAQAGLEQRRWLCVVTARDVTVCTTHLEAPVSVATVVAGWRQCAELADLLAARARRGPTVAAGDMNRFGSCAPTGMWTVTDEDAAQKPGLQHVYGSAGRLRAPAVEIVPAASTDHDFVLVTTRLVRPARP